MAATDPKFLAQGATAFAAGNWSDGVGIDATNGMVINLPLGPGGVQTNLADWGAVSTIKYFDHIAPSFGNIGGPGGSLILAGSGTTTYTTTAGTPGVAVPISRVRHWPISGDFYYTALVTCNVYQSNVGESHLTGGDFLSIHSEGSSTILFSSTATSGASGEWIMGGTGSTIDTHASDTLLDVVFYEGVHTVKRGFVTLTICGTATVYIDCADLTGTTIKQYGGTLIHLNSGLITNYHGYLGVRDTTKLARGVTYTNNKLCPGLIDKVGPNLTMTNQQPVGTGAKRG